MVETRILIEDAEDLVETDQRLALLLAAEAHNRDPAPSTLGALQQALTGSLGYLGTLGERSGYRNGVVQFSADGGRLTAMSPGAIEVFDVRTGQLVSRADVPVAGGTVQFSLPAAAIDGDGSQVALVSTDGFLYVYDVASEVTAGEPIELGDRAVSGLALSDDGAALGVAYKDGTLELWGTEAMSVRRVIQAHSAPITHLLFSPDGSVVATGTGPTGDPTADDADARIWDVETGAQLGTDLAVNIAGDALLRLSGGFAFSEDSRTIVTAGRWTIRHWDIATGQLLADFLVPGESTSADELNGIGPRMLGTDIVLSLPSGRLARVDVARDVASANLPRHRRGRAAGSRPPPMERSWRTRVETVSYSSRSTTGSCSPTRSRTLTPTRGSQATWTASMSGTPSRSTRRSQGPAGYSRSGIRPATLRSERNSSSRERSRSKAAGCSGSTRVSSGRGAVRRAGERRSATPRPSS